MFKNEKNSKISEHINVIKDDINLITEKKAITNNAAHKYDKGYYANVRNLLCYLYGEYHGEDILTKNNDNYGLLLLAHSSHLLNDYDYAEVIYKHLLSKDYGVDLIQEESGFLEERKNKTKCVSVFCDDPVTEKICTR